MALFFQFSEQWVAMLNPKLFCNLLLGSCEIEVPLARPQKLSMRVVGCFVDQPLGSTLGRHNHHRPFKSKDTHQKVG
jgi:hypothetical protein